MSAAPSPSAWVEFPAFRRYEKARQDANNAMMALLAGSKLAAHTLQLTTGSTRLLPEIFPGVDHIRYFNLATDAATELLEDTGHHLGAVALPYALSVHEDFIFTVLNLIQEWGYVQRAPGDNADPTKNRVSAWNMHEAVYMSLGRVPPSQGSCVFLEHFHVLREMRNAQIHAGGNITDRLRYEVVRMSPGAEAEWLRIARRAPGDMVSSADLHFTIFDIFAVFATTKGLGRMINDLLRETVSTHIWSNVCVDDYAAVTSKPNRSDRWARSLVGHAALYYSAAGVSESEVMSAAIQRGLWTEGHRFFPRRVSRGAARRRDRGTRYPGGE